MLRQLHSRRENIALDKVDVQFTVTQDMIEDFDEQDGEDVLLFGFWLEGAQWKDDLLVETSSVELYLEFPIIKAVTRNQIGRAHV